MGKQARPRLLSKGRPLRRRTGNTDNEDAFFDEFADELYGDDEYIEVPATDLRDWIFESMSSEEYTFFHNAAMDLIRKHYAEYQV